MTTSAPAPLPQSNRPHDVRNLSIVLFGVALLTYARAWWYSVTYLDDDVIVLRMVGDRVKPSALLDAFRETYWVDLTRLYYRPLLKLSYTLDGMWSGPHPFGFHLVSGILHAVMCVLLLRFCIELGCGLWPSCAASAIFAVHPVNVAGVVWIGGRADLLIGCSAIGALLLFHAALRSDNPSRKTWFLVGHLLCFLVAIFTKETALCLLAPFAVLLATFGRPHLLRHSAIVLPWILGIAAYFRARSLVVGSAGPVADFLRDGWEHHSAFLSDLGKLLFPVRLHVIAKETDLILWPGLVSLFVLVTTVVALRRWLRFRVVALAAALLVAPLFMAALASKFIVLEYRLYLPAAGLCLFIAEALRAVECRAAAPKAKAATVTATYACMGAVMILFLVRNLEYRQHYRDREHFAQAAIEASPGNYLAIYLVSRNAAERGVTPPGAPR